MFFQDSWQNCLNQVTWNFLSKTAALVLLESGPLWPLSRTPSLCGVLIIGATTQPRNPPRNTTPFYHLLCNHATNFSTQPFLHATAQPTLPRNRFFTQPRNRFFKQRRNRCFMQRRNRFFTQRRNRFSTQRRNRFFSYLFFTVTVSKALQWCSGAVFGTTWWWFDAGKKIVPSNCHQSNYCSRFLKNFYIVAVATEGRKREQRHSQPLRNPWQRAIHFVVFIAMKQFNNDNYN